MKSEERHRLQQNVLAEWLTEVVNTVRPYANAILATVLLVVVVLILWRWWQQQSALASEHAWDELYSAANAQDSATLDRVAEQNPGTDAASWAAVLSADIHLAAGTDDLFSNKASASQELRKAIEKYLLVRKESRITALRERATFGLARAYEAMGGTRQSEGELEKARETYEEVVKNWPDGTYQQAATIRLEDLKSQSTKAFYDKFAQYDPQPSFSTQPGEQNKPLFDSKSLPEDVAVPDFSKMLEGSKDADAKKPAEPAPSNPTDVGKLPPEEPQTPKEPEKPASKP